MEITIENTSEFSFRNRSILANSIHASCYFCIRNFLTTEIQEWTDLGETAVCPRCDVDSVLPGIIPLDILSKMCERWFTGTGYNVLPVDVLDNNDSKE